MAENTEQSLGAENRPVLTASKKAASSVLQPQRTEFCPQPSEFRRDPEPQEITAMANSSTTYQSPSGSIAPQTLESVSQLNCSHLNGNIMVLIMVLICISLMHVRYVNDVKHLFMYLEAICISSFMKYVSINCLF